MTNIIKMSSDGCFSTCKLLDLESSHVEVHEDRGSEEFRLLFAPSRIGHILLFLYYLGTLHLYTTCQQSLRNVVFSLDFHFSCAFFVGLLQPMPMYLCIRISMSFPFDNHTCVRPMITNRFDVLFLYVNLHTELLITQAEISPKSAVFETPIALNIGLTLVRLTFAFD